MSTAQARVVEHAEGFSCELPGGARALFTSRAHGNLSTQRGDGHERGRSARDRLCQELATDWLCASPSCTLRIIASSMPSISRLACRQASSAVSRLMTCSRMP